jgi:CheY-like chemotaxis protein
MTSGKEGSNPGPAGSAPGNLPQGQKGNILVVDDRAENLTAFESLLAPLGHQIILARSGQEALELAFHRTFAVVVLDVRMPSMNGIETAAILRKRESYRDTPIIFTSAYRIAVDDMIGVYVAGATDFMESPVDEELLKFKVASFVERHFKAERVRARAQEVARAFESLRLEVGREMPANSVQRRLAALEQALIGLDQELLTRISP